MSIKDSIYDDPELAALIGDVVADMTENNSSAHHDSAYSLDEDVRDLLDEAETIVNNTTIGNRPGLGSDVRINTAGQDATNAAALPIAEPKPTTRTSQATSVVNKSASKKSFDVNAFSLDEENTILNDILKSLEIGDVCDDYGATAFVTEGGGMGLGEIGDDGNFVMTQDDLDLEAALEQAERIVNNQIESAEFASVQGVSVLRVQEIQTIQKELEKARITAGAPTCIDNCLKWANSLNASNLRSRRDELARRRSKPILAVGTTLGMVLLFNNSHKMCGVCGSSVTSVSTFSTEGHPRGATTAVSFSRNGASIVAGYENGQITMWDTDTIQPLKVLDGEFPTPILRMSFSHPDAFRFAALDCKGMIKIFNVNSVMGKHVARSASIHTGFDLPCVDMSITSDIVETINVNGQSESTKELSYVAAVSSSNLSVFVASFGLQTSIALAFTSRAPKQNCRDDNSRSNNAGPGDYQVSAWVEDNSQRKLVVSWSGVIEVFHVLSDSAGHVTLQRTAQIKSTSMFVSCSYLEGCCVLFVDNFSFIHVFDASHHTIAQSVKLYGDVEFITFSFPRPIDNESPLITKQIDHGGQISHGGGIVTLQGRTKLYQCCLKTWDERVTDLLHAGRWDDLFSLAKDLSQDMAVAVVGLSSNPSERRANIHSKIEELLNAYISQMDDQLRVPGGKSNDHLINVIDKVIVFCGETQLQELYFTSVMPKLEDMGATDLGLYALEGALNNRRFSAIPSVYISNFAKLFRTPSRFNAVNRPIENALPSGVSSTDHAIQRLEVALTKVTNDLDLLAKTAEALNLYRLSACILSFRHHKYVEALQALIPVVTEPSAENIRQFEIAFEYLEKLFDGASLVDGETITTWHQKPAKQSVVAYLVADPKALNALLKHDTLRCINFLTKVIDPSVATTQPNIENPHSPNMSKAADEGPWGGTAKVTRSDLATALYAQLIDTTIPANRPWEYERKKWPSYASVLQLYINLSRCLANGLISFASAALDDDFMLRTSFHFTNAFEKASLERRTSITNSFVNLISSEKWSENISPTVENELKSKRLGRVHASLLARRGDFMDAIACFLAREYNQVDPYLSKGVFTFISSEMKRLTRHQDRDESVSSLRHAVKSQLSNLIHIDAVQLSQIVFEYLPDDHREVFQALQGIGDNTFLLYMRGMIAKGDRAVKEDKYAQNVYIGLLCKHEPETVYDYLVKNESEIQYDLGQALHDCQKYSVTDATILLLEKTVQIAQAMESLMAAVTKNLLNLRADVIRNSDHYRLLLLSDGKGTGSCSQERVTAENLAKTLLFDNDKPLSTLSVDDEKLARMVNLGIDLCTRYNHKLPIEDLKVWWFRLLDRFAAPKRVLHDRLSHFQDGNYHQHHNPNLNVPHNGYEDNEIELLTKSGTFPLLSKPLTSEGVIFLANMQAVYARYVSHVLTAMVKTLPISTVVGKIIADNERDSFGPFKPIIVGILETLSFDLEANRLCKLCADGDTLLIANDLRRTATAAIIPISTECGICQKHLSTLIGDVDSLRLYPCGHSFHEVCCGTLQQCYICSNYEENHGDGLATDSSSLHDDIPRPNKEASLAINVKKAAIEPQNVDIIMRRLRQVRGKLDNAKIYRDMLHSITKGGSAEKTRNGNDKKRERLGGAIIIDGVNISEIDTSAFGGGSNLLLAPPQIRSSLSVSDIMHDSHAVVRVPQAPDEELTDADLVAIFGKTAYDSMRHAAAEEAAQIQLGLDQTIEDDDDVWESEAMKELMGLK